MPSEPVQGVREVRRSLALSFNEPVGGAADGDNVVVPGTPSSTSSGGWVSVAPPPLSSFRPIAPPGAVVFRGGHRDPRLAPSSVLNLAVPGPAARLVVAGPLARHAGPASRLSDLVKRAGEHVAAPPTPPKKKARRGDLEDSDDIAADKLRVDDQRKDDVYMGRQKNLLITGFKFEFDSIGRDSSFSAAAGFGHKLLGVMEGDASKIAFMHRQKHDVASAAIENEKEWAGIVTTVNDKLQDSKEHVKKLEAYGRNGASIVKALLTSAEADKKKHLAAEARLAEVTQLLAERSEVLDMFKQVSVIPYCGKCMDKVGFRLSDTIYRMGCGVLRCHFCKGGDVCSQGICAGGCKVVYEVQVEDYLEEIEFARNHVMDKYATGVVDCQNKHEEPPEALNAFRIAQHKRLSRSRF
jgi:hypothetical protein